MYDVVEIVQFYQPKYLMRSVCVVRTRFILNNFSGIGGGVPGPPFGYARALR